MLERILEPEVMDTPDDAAEYDAIDNRVVNEEFAVRALALAPAAGTVLDAGAGPGHIAVLVAARAPALRVVAVDLAETMLARAREHVAGAALGDRIELVRADAKATGFADGRFDMVMSNSMVHHLPDPAPFFAEARRVARAGAALFIKDLLRPADLDEWHHLVATYAADCTAYQRRLFSDSLRAALRLEEVAAMCERAGLRGVTVARVSDRHWSVERRAAA